MNDIIIKTKDFDYFNLEPYQILFESSNGNGNLDHFRVLKIQRAEYGIGWSSDEVVFNEEVHTRIIEDQNVLIWGIHNKIFIFSLQSGIILFASGLEDSIDSIELLDLNIWIFTESSALKISRYNFSIQGINLFPDVISQYSIDNKNKVILINCEGGEDFVLNF